MSTTGARSGMTTGAMLAGAVAVLALPSAVLAFTARFVADPVRRDATADLDAFRADATGPRLARGPSLRSLAPGAPYLFTPAKNPNRPDRSVTVAVRIDPQAIQTIAGAAEGAPATLRIAPTAFSLGLARGYRDFASEVGAPGARRGDPPDLSHYSLAGGGGAHEPSRFSPHVVLDDKPPTGRAPQTFADRGDQVDVGGAYRLTRNLDVTAGVRYSQDRERLVPLTDNKLDSQAVYVGTQLRF